MCRTGGQVARTLGTIRFSSDVRCGRRHVIDPPTFTYGRETGAACGDEPYIDRSRWHDGRLEPMAGVTATQVPYGLHFRLPFTALSGSGRPDPFELSRTIVGQGAAVGGLSCSPIIAQ